MPHRVIRFKAIALGNINVIKALAAENVAPIATPEDPAIFQAADSTAEEFPQLVHVLRSEGYSYDFQGIGPKHGADEARWRYFRGSNRRDYFSVFGNVEGDEEVPALDKEPR